MIVDSSAMIAILREEPEAEMFRVALVGAPWAVMSAVSVLEISLVLGGRGDPAGVWARFERFVANSGIGIVPFDAEQALVAREAFLTYGKGRHPAGLNLGDCAAYALAKLRHAPILFKGQNFSRTDLQPAAPVH